MSTWLHKQRKGDLNALADEAGLRGHAAMKKEDLISALDDHLQKNSTALSGASSFEPYYKTSARSAASDSDAKPAKPRARRVTKHAGEHDPETSPERASTALVAKTPRAVQRAAARIPLPPSPSAVTDLVERQASRVTSRVQHYWDQSGVMAYLEAIRENLSSVSGIMLALSVIEYYGLQRETMPWRHAFTFPGSRFTDPVRVSAPDMFVLLTASFWAPSTLWALTSIFVPMAVAWFFNLTIHAGSKRRTYTIDPLVFNIVKAITSYLVYSHGMLFFGTFSGATALRVKGAVPGNWFGIVIGSLIGIVASLYEAVLRK